MRILSIAALAASGIAASATAWAHGTLEMPISRVYACYQEGPESPKSEACKAAKTVAGPQAFYDWNGVRQGDAGGNHQAVVPDGQICSGGGAEFRGLDLARPDWTASSIVPTAAGDYTFVWKATAAHATSSFRYFITKTGWSPNAPLKWSDLEEFATVPGSAAQKVGDQYRMTVKLPQGKKGGHVIYGIWQRADSREAFYACSDVKFPGDGTPVPTTGWEDQGPLIANSDLAAGSTVTLRVFDPNGRDAGKHSVTLTAATGKAAMWPYTLAEKVNAESQIFRIGVLQSGSGTAGIVPVQSATANRLYLSKAYPGYSTEIDKQAPSGGGGTGSWVEGGTYTVGQTVTYQGRSYRCLQAHTAWVGAGWTPATSPTLWQAL